MPKAIGRRRSKSFSDTYMNMPISSIDVSQLASDIREMVRFGDHDFDLAMLLWDAVKDRFTTKAVTGQGEAAAETVDITCPDNKYWDVISAKMSHDDAGGPRNSSFMVVDSVAEGSTGQRLMSDTSLANGVNMILQEEIPGVLPVRVSAGGKLRCYCASIAAGKKITYAWSYNEYDLI